MNTTTSPADPDTFWASVDSRFLEKVDRVFDASPLTVWIELLQNARRAGADEVSVSLTTHNDNHVNVRFEDNGSGCESPTILLRLAARGWDAEIDQEEDPAGMGFFCLANFASVNVTSRLWNTTLTPQIFRGAEPAHKKPNEVEVTGMVVEWRWDDADVRTLEMQLRAAAEFCGLKRVGIRVDGVPTATVKPSDFMDGCAMVRKLPALGVTIGAREAPQQYLYSYDGGRPKLKLNFRGVILEWISDSMGPHLQMISNCYVQILVEVAHTRELQLVLPARNAVKHNAARTALLEECEKLVYEWIAARAKPAHKLPYCVYKRALEKFSVDLGEAEFKLSQISHFSPQAPGLRLLAKSLANQWNDFEQVLSIYNRDHFGKESCLIPYVTDKDMEGYSWYDAMPRMTDMIARVDGREMRLESLADCQLDKHDDDKHFYEFVDDIEVEILVDNGESYKCRPSAIVAGESTVNFFDALDRDIRIFLSRAILTDPKLMYEVIDRLSSSLFEVNGESDDSAETQQEDFDKELTAGILSLCGRKKAALFHILEQEARGIGYEVRDAGLSWTIRYDGRFHNEEDYPGMQVVSFQYSKEEADNHKLLCASPRGQSDWIEELVSDSAITHERVEAYLRKQHGFDDDDGWVLDSYGKPVDLDKWEKENLAGKEEPTDG